MTEKEYRSSAGISRSELKQLAPRYGGSPEKYMWAKLNGQPEPTRSMVFGTLAHLALLEPERFGDEFAFAPEVDGRTKAGKEALAAFRETLGDRTAVSKDDWAKACLMANEVNRYPFGRKLLGGSHEVSLRWVDPDTEEECKIRADAVMKVGGTPVIVDYKTTTDASAEAFAKKSVSMGYDFQAGMYCEGYEKVTGYKPRFVFIVQETEAPFAVNVMEADEEFIQRGKDIFRELIGIYHECKLTDNWWGYMGANCEIGRLSLPAWAVNV